MKRILWGMAVAVLAAGSADAALLSRAGGQAYYDTALDITWLADANYAETSGYASGGWMTWDESQTWVGSLNAANHLGVNDWRLPLIVDTGAPGCDYAYSGTDCGYNVQTLSGSTVYGEMAHLYYVTLGNLGVYDTSGAIQPGWGLTNTGPFSNVQPLGYWSGTAYAPDPGYAWSFGFFGGYQLYDYKGSYYRAWAVRPGDIEAVPAPGALWLFGTGLAALGAQLKRRARSAGAAA